MYTANDLKKDLLVNIKDNPAFDPNLYNILLDCQFQFNDSGEFTRIVWNTFKRDLVIFCAGENRAILDKEQKGLFQLCDKIHGNKDDFLLMSLEIIAKSDLSKTKLTDTIIQIKNEIVIERIVENELGHGGFGKVYKYYDENTQEMYAYKIYEPSVFQESSPEIMKKRFIREGKKLLHYSHENVVKAYEFGFLGDESAYIKLEHITGKKLIDYLNENTLNQDAKEELCRQYISAMAYVHEKSDMHRDISYSNVMVDIGGNIKVLDFGFARGNDDTNYDTVYKDISHKFAPEDEKYGILTEVYCIGAILFSIVTNGSFSRDKLDDLNNCECNPFLIKAIQKCLSANPQNRYENAVALKNSLFSDEYAQENSNLKPISEFSLDYFRDMISEIKLYFTKSHLPDFDSIKIWIESDLKDIIESHVFLSKISLLTFLQKLPYLEDYVMQSNTSYEYDKEPFENMYNFYMQLPENMMSVFVKNILIIILENSFENSDIPFN